MKEIPLSNGGFAIVDDADFDYLSQWSWRRASQTGYPRRSTSKSGKWLTIDMHRQLLGPAPAGYETDHKNRNRLDNRRENLRFVNPRVNRLNRGSLKVQKHGRKWTFLFPFEEGIRVRVSGFKTKEEAQAVYALLKASLIYYELTKGSTHG